MLVEVDGKGGDRERTEVRKFGTEKEAHAKCLIVKHIDCRMYTAPPSHVH